MKKYLVVHGTELYKRTNYKKENWEYDFTIGNDVIRITDNLENATKEYNSLRLIDYIQGNSRYIDFKAIYEYDGDLITDDDINNNEYDSDLLKLYIDEYLSDVLL